jgi:enamine deaminase RidA (YjgF/YER057c/UK114 family)
LLPATVRAQHAAPGAAPLAVLPHGAKVYVSGDASSGDMATATANTMNSLSRTLEQLGLDRSHIVQLKCFLQPMSQVSVVEQELAKFFADTRLPPVILVEWTLSGPIEIELIAAAPADSRAAQLVADDTVAYFTPAGVKASPVFSRVACINSPRTIYTAGLYSRTAGSGADEVRDVFAQLKSLVEQSGSDLRHLVKATYYVATNDASTQLGALRPDFYDPPRPPAASKAGVTATGMPGRNLMIDMIAVPVR